MNRSPRPSAPAATFRIVPQTSASPSLADFQQAFLAHGLTDQRYLSLHFERYVQTKNRLLSSWNRARGVRVLDVGAHWLHQAVLYAMDGFEVTALDMPVTFEMADVRSIADAHRIRLVSEPDLEKATALARIPDDSFDIVLFTEIIEHITFNPVAMWREIYRVMAPGAHIVVTTPNYYAWRGRAWHWGRFFDRFGGGLSTIDILTINTHANHWKEYSLRELVYYFCVLSPDFDCTRQEHLQEYYDGYLPVKATWLSRGIEATIPILRPEVYLEVELRQKSKGIVVEPHW